MSEPLVHDLDVLRPQPEYVKLGGKKIDISFIPAGVAMDVMVIQQELEKLTNTPEKLKRIQSGGKEAKRSFEIAAELCAAICSSQHKEMDKEWLLKNTDSAQIKALLDCITVAVMRSMENAEDDEVGGETADEGSP